MAGERVWLTHPGIPGSAFNCPPGAVEDWRAIGWVDGEAPAETNLAAVEQPVYEASAPAEDAAKPSTKTPKGSD